MELRGAAGPGSRSSRSSAGRDEGEDEDDDVSLWVHCWKPQKSSVEWLNTPLSSSEPTLRSHMFTSRSSSRLGSSPAAMFPAAGPVPIRSGFISGVEVCLSPWKTPRLPAAGGPVPPLPLPASGFRAGLPGSPLLDGTMDRSKATPERRTNFLLLHRQVQQVFLPANQRRAENDRPISFMWFQNKSRNCAGAFIMKGGPEVPPSPRCLSGCSACLLSVLGLCGRIKMSDPCSFSSFSTCLTKHLNLQLHVDFDRHVIRGKVQLTVEALEDRFSVLTLDSRDLNVSSVSVNQQTARFELGPKHSFKGTPLVITLPYDLSRGQQVIVEVTYETSPSASALQWLTPEQTAGKKQPYLFSQCQAHHCRSMVPCQDTPSIKHTYYAQVSVPKQLVALMSAVRDGQEVDPQDSGRIVYRFRQPVAMPSYLIAIVVGALESREIGPRSRVWSETEFVDKAASEFSETETMLQTAEDLAGPYVWGQYDVLVLPPSFPYGGMENPCLTFATPTVLAGDKSLSGVIAHEISHSWTGNLVTNRTWEHFWLNEGHTVYLERMIGRRMEGEQFRQFKAIGGWSYLQDSVNTFGANNPLTNLVPSLQEVDPDDAFSLVPYEKGFALLYHLEELMGGPEVFMGFVKSYIQRFAYSSVTTDDWKNYLFTYFKDKVDILNKVDWNGWMFTPGMPPVKPQYDTTLADACIALTQRWIKAKDQDLNVFSQSDVKTLSSHQLIEFLSLLLQEEPLPLSHAKKMQDVYDLNASTNSEIRFRWLRLCVRSQWEEAVPLALKMATEQGRMKFTRPLFREVFNFEKHREEAVRVFMAHRAAMHPVTSGLVAKDLKVDASSTGDR